MTDDQNQVEIGDRQQNLIFIGQNMDEYKDKIIEALDKCLVDEDEWNEMMTNGLVQKVENDPFDGVQGYQEFWIYLIYDIKFFRKWEA